MYTYRRIIAVAELVLIFPAVLFLAAVVARGLLPLHDAAQQIVSFYAGRIWTLWVLLLALPLTALLTGCVTLLSNTSQGTRQPSALIGAHLPTRIIAVGTLAAGVILVVVVLHMLAN